MKKVIMEKLLHTYKELDPNVQKVDKYSGESVLYAERASEHMTKYWRDPQHFNGTREAIDLTRVYKYFKSLSNEIQNSAKFFIDLKGEGLTPEESQKIVEETPFIMPYESCFLQFDTGDVVLNMIVLDDNETDVDVRKSIEDEADIQHGIFHIAMFPYIVADNIFIFDPNIYTFRFNQDDSYTFWLDETEENPFGKFVDTQADASGMYQNKSLNQWTTNMSSMLITFFLLMHYPQITKTKKVKGIKPRPFVESRSRYKHSELMSKPTWEHKTLVLDLYGNDTDTNGTTNGARSKGTAFHSVRKHLRRLPNGRHTFVKAHFRGAKEIGIIQKDYEVRT